MLADTCAAQQALAEAGARGFLKSQTITIGLMSSSDAVAILVGCKKLRKYSNGDMEKQPYIIRMPCHAADATFLLAAAHPLLTRRSSTSSSRTPIAHIVQGNNLAFAFQIPNDCVAGRGSSRENMRHLFVPC